MSTRSSITKTAVICIALSGWLGQAAPAQPEPQLTPEQKQQFENAKKQYLEVLRLQGLGKAQEALPLARQVLQTSQTLLGEEHPSTATIQHVFGSLLLSTGDYAAAKPYLEQSLKVRRKVLGEEHADTATSLSDMGAVYYYLDDHLAAKPYFEEALKIYRKLLGDEHLHTAPPLRFLAAIFHSSGEYAKARLYYEQALKITRKERGEEHLETATVINNLGLLHSEMGDYAAARPLLVQSLKVKRKLLGEDNPATATTLGNLGLLLHKTGDYAEARAYLEQALRINRKVLGEEHTKTALAHNNLGGPLEFLGHYGTARSCYEQALKIWKKVHGPEHPDTARALDNLGGAYRRMGEYGAAKSYHEQALRIRKKVLGEKHPDTAVTINNMGLVLHDLGDYAAARPYYDQALQINRTLYGEENANTAHSLHNLSSLLQSTGKLEEARKHCEQALRIRRRVLGEEHPDTAQSLNNLGLLLMSLGDHAAARKHLDQALKVQKKRLGENHLDVGISLNNLGLLAKGQGDFAAARTFYEQSLAIDKKILGERHSSTALSLNNLGLTYVAMGDYGAAKPYFEQALKIRKEVLGEEHRNTAGTLSSLGLLHSNIGYFGKARQYYEQALKINRKVLGEDHADTAQILSNLGALLSDTDDLKGARSYLELALKIQKNALGENHLDTALSLNNLGCVLNSTGELAAARKYHEQALRIRTKALGEHHPDTASSLNNLMVLEGAAGNWSRAVELTDQARRGLRVHVARVLPALSEREQLVYLRRHHEFTLYGALSLGYLRRDDPSTVTRSATWLLNGKGLSQATLAERALLLRDVAESHLAATVKELIDVRQQLSRLALNAAPRGQESARDEKLRQLTGTEERLAQQVALSRDGASGATAWVELETLRKSLRPDAVFVDLIRFEPFNFQTKGTEPRFQPARYVAWITPAIGQGEVQLIDLGLAGPIEKGVAAAQQSIAAAGGKTGVLQQRGERIAELQFRATLQSVADLVWKPLSDKLGNAKRIVLSPDAALWLLPLGALPAGDDKLLIEKYVLEQVVSGRDIVAAAQARPESRLNPPVVFANPQFDLSATALRTARETMFGKGTEPAGDLRQQSLSQLGKRTLPKASPLPSTQVEAESIAPQLKTLAGVAPQLYTGHYALESVVKAVHRPKIVTLSTHGFFLPDQEVKQDAKLGLGSAETRSVALTVEGKPLENPLLRCGLLLAGCNSPQTSADDGVLTGMEIVGVDLRGTELVVLSACETGVGTVRNGEGVAGLRQAFQLAGAKAVVATLWQIPDVQSAQLMNDFFRNLAAGESRGDALRNAQLKRIQSRKSQFGAAHPYFWAAFTLTGL